MKKKKTNAAQADLNEQINITGSAPASDVGTAADVDEVMKKYDRESNVRQWEGIPGLVIKILLAEFLKYARPSCDEYCRLILRKESIKSLLDLIEVVRIDCDNVLLFDTY